MAYASAVVLILALASPAAADTIAITAGSATLYWDGSLTSFGISSDDSQFSSEYHESALAGFSGGSTVDFSTSIPATNGGFHPLAQTYHGQQFQAWVTGSLNITADPFVAPHANGDGSTFQTFSTTFTMTGTITAYPTSDRTGTPLFTTQVTGSGTVSATYRVVGDEYTMNSGAEVFRFAAPASSGLPSPWTSTDVGDVGRAGGATYSGGVFSVSGSGADIWGSADSFHFVPQAVNANVDIVTRVTSEQNTHTFAKAGLMIRGSVAADSWDVIVDVKPGGGVEFMTRAVTGGGATTTFVAGRSSSFPVWLKLSRHHETFVAASTSSDGVSWSSLGAVVVPRAAALVGLAVTSHDTSVTNAATFDNVDVAQLPDGWFRSDVGAVGRGGRASEANGVFSVSGAGSDIWAYADSFEYVSTPLGGDGSMSAQVVSEQNTHPFAKAGIVFGLAAPSDAGVILDVKPDATIEFMARFADGQAMSFIAGASTAFPVMLKITRVSDVFTGSISSDNVTWTTVGSVTISMPAAISVGLAVTSHDPNVLNTSTFDRVSATAVAPPPSPQNLLINPGFEDSTLPGLGPGWVSDAFRQAPAQSETEEPRSGRKNGACRTTTSRDCGIYQDVVAPTTGMYTLTTYTNASRPGAVVGWNRNGTLLSSASVSVGSPGSYSASYASHQINAADTIRVWLYSPATPGSAVIDDVAVTLQPQ